LWLTRDHTMQSYGGGDDCIAPRINLRTRWRRVIISKPQAAVPMSRWLDEAPQPTWILWRRGTFVAPAATYNTFLQRPDSSLVVKLTTYITYSQTYAHTGPIINQNLISLQTFRIDYSPTPHQPNLINVRQKFKKWNTRKKCHYLPIMCPQLFTLYEDRTPKDWTSGSEPKCLRYEKPALVSSSDHIGNQSSKDSVSSKETFILSYTTVRT
jgi:hypothetical protein